VSEALEQLDAWASGLLANLSPSARRALAREIAMKLRQSQQQRMAAQLNPDGTPYAPRKPQLQKKEGRIRRAMFAKLRTSRFMKTEATAEGAFVGFLSQVERIALVHQRGLRDRVQAGGPECLYPARELLGISETDQAIVETLVLNRLG
jgi:phage virion morphogenesis protein